ncbi:hypothetical protein G6514_008489 [Epicoccum nigrum]|nr:hypothetical protein G6514_008489 [Epicoccum nigrum]
MPLQTPRSKPTPYPALPFHFLRTVQLLASLVVLSITFYFLRELRKEGYSFPWTFILLLTTALLTLLTLASTLFLQLRQRPRPRLALALNGALAPLWVVSSALLGWWSSSTLRAGCGREAWETDVGTNVCRAYKALFAFAFLGTAGTLAALALDGFVVKRSGRGGRFVALQPHVHDGVWDGNATAELSGTGRRRARDGYAVPEGQWRYDDHEVDTGYRGAGEPVRQRSVERRM